ncbi:MAG: hypothetical protein ACRDFW_07980, partial [bacterium]
MNLRDLFSFADHFKNIQGIEGRLRRRQRNGLLLTTGTILLGIFEIIRELARSDESFFNYFSRVLTHSLFAIEHLGLFFSGKWDSRYAAQIDYGVAGFYVVVLGIVVYLLSRHTAFLLEKSEEAFRYTFWIDRFAAAEGSTRDNNSPSEKEPLCHLLHHDLMGMLNQRIGRFSLLDEKHFKSGSEATETPPSHIHVDGHYALRSREYDGTRRRVIQILPKVRIGPPGNPSILTQPVEVQLAAGADKGDELAPERPANREDSVLALDPKTYEQILEQVYSKVASEIYKQLKSDIENKLHLFPTKYLRAVALYYEAVDFSRSNTIDSYDYAIELYEKAVRYYDVSFRSLLANLLIWCPVLRFGIGYELMHARTKIEYAKSLIYRRQVSSLTGRKKNPVYAVPFQIRKVASRLARAHNKFHVIRWNITSMQLEPGRQPNPAGTGRRNRLRLT